MPSNPTNQDNITEKISKSKTEERTGSGTPISIDDKQIVSITNKYAAVASVAGLIPVPVLDLAALVGIQVKMVHEIARTYGKNLKDEALRVAISSLITTIPANSFASVGTSAFKAIPLIGTIFGGLTAVAYYGASTYAVGKIFDSHFSSGGDLLNFRAQDVKSAYVNLVKKETDSTGSVLN
ncbi:YcjF family protein [Marinoscillum luteum]|uniref:YcjF family protein n=1 Tax=Marinoscillum luteum TaxID=861051 RepID=A0ABW7N7R2_9BACT